MKKVTKLMSLLFMATFALHGCINDADVAAPDIANLDQKGNLALTFEIPNVSGTRDAESSGVTETGSESEYKIKELTVYIFDATTKMYIEKHTLTDFTYATPNGSTIRYNTKKITVEAGLYNIFAIANGKIDVNNSMAQDEFLASIDKITYNQGKITNVPDDGFMMSNRGDANLNIKVDDPESATINSISISMERVVAKIELTQTQESFPLKDEKDQVYCTVKLNNFRFLNLATQFYTFRHTAVLNDFQEPSSYTTENFGNIKSGGYVIDPYFFKKSPNIEDAKNFTNADGFFADALVQLNKDDGNWTGMNNPNSWSHIYCLENCMFSTAQRNAYSTGVMFNAALDIATDHVFNEKGENVSNKSDWPARLYYCGKRFFTSIDAIKFKYQIPDEINENSTAEELAIYHIKYFDKKSAGYSCYYNYWIRHEDNKLPEMGIMEFGIVRNNIYRLSVNKISDLGTDEPTIKPEQPDEDDTILNIDFEVFPWVVRNQDVEL